MNRINSILFKKILITIGLVLFYKVGFYFFSISKLPQALPLLNHFEKGSYSLFSLGFMPALSGYFLVEVIFLLIPKLRTIRNNGLDGRKIISNWSLGVSVVIALMQAWALVGVLAVAFGPEGTPIITDPTFFILILHALFFVAGFALVLFIGNLISKYGIGNGFCVFIGISIVEEIYRNISSHILSLNANSIKPNYVGLLALAFLLFFLFKFLFKKDWIIRIDDERISSIRLPFFLQGATVIIFASSLYPLFAYLYKIPEYGTWSYAFLLSFLTVASSAFGYWLFSGRKRIASDLSLKEGSIIIDANPFIRSTMIIFFITLIFNIPFPFGTQMFVPHIVFLFSAITLMAIGYDFWSQFSFCKMNEDIVEIGDYDNVYLASALIEKLEKAQIAHCFQGYQYRRLYFFFQPFIKMKLLVPKNKREEVQHIIESLKISRI